MLKQLPRPGSAKLEPTFESTNGNWTERLLQRPYRFPASGESEQDLSAYITHGGVGYYFPLQTPDADRAAARAREIYEMAAKQGWTMTCRQFSRELIVSFKWCMDPVLWTYTTIHTLVNEKSGPKPDSLARRPERQHIMVLEPDAGVRRALCWCVDQQEGFASIPCDSVESFQRVLALHRPCLVLLNHKLAERIDLKSGGFISHGRQNILALRYSVHVDGDQMFACTPGGVGGYLITRVKPGQLLEPIIKVANRSDLMAQNVLLRVKYYFQELLQLRSSPETSPLSKLTQRERETLEFLSKGLVEKEIAQAMGISAWTVHGHIKSIFERLQVHTRTEAVIRYLEK